MLVGWVQIGCSVRQCALHSAQWQDYSVAEELFANGLKLTAANPPATHPESWMLSLCHGARGASLQIEANRKRLPGVRILFDSTSVVKLQTNLMSSRYQGVVQVFDVMQCCLRVAVC